MCPGKKGDCLNGLCAATGGDGGSKVWLSPSKRMSMEILFDFSRPGMRSVVK